MHPVCVGDVRFPAIERTVERRKVFAAGRGDGFKVVRAPGAGEEKVSRQGEYEEASRTEADATVGTQLAWEDWTAEIESASHSGVNDGVAWVIALHSRDDLMRKFPRQERVLSYVCGEHSTLKLFLFKNN